ncbi:MAG: hypothetical protein CVU04_03235 [Bacteroidetes bacterium HGW-Bacteroidetes-20]|nr:MAG: hypothetical protein CVU04_03235 [Bacteroidetes bacterium HGW-Bacteroidetes-20]
MKESLVTQLYNATNSGLDIIYYYYPQARDVEGQNKKFKIRTSDKTPSASLKKFGDVWKVTDFGDEGSALSPVEICMKEERKEFREALHILLSRFNVTSNAISVDNKPEIIVVDATEDEKEGDFTFEFREKFTPFELSVLGPCVTQQTVDRYMYYSVVWYAKVKNRKKTIIRSTETYPIFMRECKYDKVDGDVKITKTFRKLYQPLNADKGYRFFYDGEKPKDYINGLSELKVAYDKRCKEIDNQAELVHDDKKTPDTTIVPKERKLPEAILASGERDALNIAGMGYFPLWMNSETAHLTDKQYKEIMGMVEKLYNIPDIDDTGIKKGIELALEYIDTYTIELPLSLKEYKDNRGKPRKDLRDFLDIKSPSDFKDLMKMANPCRFWERIYTKEGSRVEINTVYLLHFLRYNGFGKITDVESEKVTYIHVENYKVKEISGKQIRNFIIQFLEERKVETEIRNLVLNSRRTGVSLMDDLKDFYPNFCDYTPNSQVLFFANTALKVSKDNVEEIKGKDLNIFVWEKDIAKHNFKRIAKSFDFTFDKEDNEFDFEIKHTKSHYFRFLINASRIYWREELENSISESSMEDTLKYCKENKWKIDGSRLTHDQVQEQKAHLLNKIYTIGYLLHRYKSFSKGLGVWVMENKITEEDESSGGSGKSFMIEFLRNLCRVDTMDGRNKKLTENQFLMDRIDEHTDILRIDDAHRYFDFDFFYSMITGTMVVNAKNVKSKEISFKDSAKLVITSNFPPKEKDSSTMRRLLLTVFSDYYHKRTDENDYNEDRTIGNDFGYDLHDDLYKDEYWNEDFNFCVDCLQFYLNAAEKSVIIQPPMTNINRRINIHRMGDEFREWAEVFFSEEGPNVNRPLVKSEVKDSYDPKGKIGSKTFKNKLIAFCQNSEHIEAFNPEDVKGYDPRSRRIVLTEEGKTQEYIYIRTKSKDPGNEIF